MAASNNENAPATNNDATNTPPPDDPRDRPLSMNFSGGEVLGTATRVLQRGIYDISEEIIIPAGSSMRLQGGSVMRFSPGVGITVFGRLEALDTERCELVAADPRGGFAGILVEGENSSLRLNSCDLRCGHGRPVEDGMKNAGGAILARQSINVALRGCRIVECEVDGQGGAIALIQSTGIIEGCEFERNRAGESGGAISAMDSRSTLVASKFSGNRAEGTGGGAMGILGGSALLQECQFDGNQAAEHGGAIVSGRATLELNGVRFTQNQAGQRGNGGAMAINASKLTIYTGQFEANTAASGGGIALSSPVGEVRLEGITAARNTASQAGGFLVADAAERIILPACQLHENRAVRGGAIHLTGGQLVIDRATDAAASTATLADNQATSGGAIHAIGSRLQISAATFTGNRAEESGGAIHLTQAPAELTLNDCRFNSNRSAGHGGALNISDRASIAITGGQTVFEGNVSNKDGGALRLDSAGPSTIRDATFRSNAASPLGVAMDLPPRDRSPSPGQATGGEGGAAWIGFCNATFANCKFSGNRAGAGGALAFTCTANRENLTIDTCELTDNRALLSGGAVVVSAGTVTIVNSTASGNESSTSGGALSMTRSAEVRIRASRLIDNIAHRFGGAISVAGARLRASDATSFSGNHSIRGGAINIDRGSSDCSISACEFRLNVVDGTPAERNPGGAIAILDSKVDINSSTFHGNRCRIGPAVFIEQTSAGSQSQRTEYATVKNRNTFTNNWPEGPDPVALGNR